MWLQGASSDGAAESKPAPDAAVPEAGDAEKQECGCEVIACYEFQSVESLLSILIS